MVFGIETDSPMWPSLNCLFPAWHRARVRVYLLCAICFGYLLVLWFDLLESARQRRLLYLYLGVSAYSSGRDYLIYGRGGREIYLIFVCCLYFFCYNNYLPSAANKELRSSHDEVCWRFTMIIWAQFTHLMIFNFYFGIWDFLSTVSQFFVRFWFLNFCLRPICQRRPAGHARYFLLERLAMHTIGDRLYDKSTASTHGGDRIYLASKVFILPYLE